MKSTVGARIAPALALCAAGATLPAATVHFLGREEVHIPSIFHFWAVGATAFAATAAALALTVVGARREDARTVIVGTAFSVMAALLALHGLAFLGAALGAALLLDFQDLGWWLGHGFELVGILLVGIPVAADLYRGAPSRTLTGGPRAGELVSAEEAFLGARVRALMVRLAEKDEYTEEHTRRVGPRAVQVGEELGLTPNRLPPLAPGGLLHDIGKLSVPDAILKKPGSLEESEFAVIQRHPEWGHRLLGELGGFSEAVRRLVLDHHERLDGKGYPHGRLGEELDLETRILAVCDVYDALLSVRIYRPAWSHERAMALLHEETSTAFDAGCVAALERVLRYERALSLGVAV